MVKVIKNGYVHQIECNYCHSVLEYHNNDISQEWLENPYDEHGKIYTVYGRVFNCISCPVCGNKVIIV